MVARSVALRFLAFLMVAMSATVFAACGDDEKPPAGRPADPKAAIEQSLERVGELKTGKLEGAVIVTLSGPLSSKAQAKFNGPFDMTDTSQPAYSIGGTFQWGRDPAAPFGLAAKDATRYVSIGKDDFSHDGEPNEGAANPLSEVSSELAGLLENHAIATEQEGAAEGVQLYSAKLNVERFQEAAIKMFNALLQPGAQSTALGGGQIQGLLESAIQEAEGAFGIDENGVLQTIAIETDGGYQIIGSKQTIRISVDLAIESQDQPVTIEVPADPEQLDSAEELDQKLGDFFAEQIPISF